MDEGVECLLRSWDLESYIPKFKENHITSMVMDLLGPEEIKELFPRIGHRVLFTRNLIENKKLWYPYAKRKLAFETQLGDLAVDSAFNIQEFPDFN